MPLTRLLIVNRGEIAIRIARAAAELGIATVAVYAEDDAHALHVRRADDAHALRGSGPAAYLDISEMLLVAEATGCDAVHPGYGFLSENAGFARRCAEAGLCFVGPDPDTLSLFGDKAQARAFAARCGVPLARGTDGAATPAQVADFARWLDAPIMIKAVAGGGGRGMRIVSDPAEVDEAYARCASEAQAAFGDGSLYAEELIRPARHVEVQIIGDGTEVSHVWERECSLQRRHQKLVECAPCPALTSGLRQRLLEAALCMAGTARYRGLGTFEFLVQPDSARFIFIEANPRLQVEHTVTEQITGIDLVQAQLRIAAGASLADLRLRQADIPRPHGSAVQVRVNMETIDAAGNTLPSAGTLTAYDPPSGPGVRVDGFGYVGYTTSPRFDSLLAKVIAQGPTRADAMARAYRALCEFRIDGVPTNIPLAQSLCRHPDVRADRIDTGFVERRITELVNAGGAHPRLYFDGADSEGVAETVAEAPAGTLAVASPMDGLVISIDVEIGDMVAEGQVVAIVEAMKLELTVRAEVAGTVRGIAGVVGNLVKRGHPLLFIEPGEAADGESVADETANADAIRADLAETLAVHAVTLDPARPAAVARRRKTGQMTARENVAALCDPDSFVEYGALAVAAQRLRRPVEELIDISPADGIVTGIGSVNGQRCAVLAYDYTVFAGTQGWMGHAKKDRMFELAEQWRLPVVIFTEGGGGRPGETDHLGVGIETNTFRQFGRLSGLVPLVGVSSGRCFAGNAALLGCCDVVIATEGSSIGMGGPAMIEGGGLGVFRPEEVGPVPVQSANGVIDLVARDDAHAVELAKRYLSYFQGPVADWSCADQAALRRLIPENRRRAYDVRTVIETLADVDSVLELRPGFGQCLVTALVRIEGRPIGLIASDPMHLAGAIDADGADKGSRFLQLCDAFDLPVVTLCDTPGFMVGPAAEKEALVRHACRLFVTGANIEVPTFTVVLRRGYGLGALALSGGSFHSALFTVCWPTGEFGGMGLEGAVRLAYRKELAAIEDPAEKQRYYETKLADLYERGKGISAARFLEIDDVIDPAATRDWIMRGLASVPPKPDRTAKKRRNIDTW
ncbi:carboxyl transferase domain-containing protein [Rhodopila sp.]|uniref:carboxyl transferase domain-containing protein n=1 Tax=Rhodopila sp. TaxID=2480087 RepID=UPI002C196786|nr:carboxyl transferase domain-containing protein [Rhodopila sp.]HVZ10403.1 carboxyl transferase domain-containing protein [Rhodopila sp.]